MSNPSRPASLTYRLTLMFSAVATVVFLMFGWMIGNSIEEHFVSEDHKELTIIFDTVNRSLSNLQQKDDIEKLKQRFGDILVGHHGALLNVKNNRGEVIYNSKKLDLSSIPTSSNAKLEQHSLQLWHNDEHNFRILRNKVNAKNGEAYFVIIAVITDFHTHFTQSFRQTLWLMVISGIIIMGLMGWIAVKHGHRPIHRIVEQISQIKTDGLNTRLTPDSVPSELIELANSFNALLQRIEEAFARLSHFSDDIAHELRTPVTNLMTQTQVALSQSRNTAEYQEILYSNIEEYERMAQMIGDMLFLAKTDNGLQTSNLEDINLAEEIQNLFDYYEAWAEERHVSLIMSGKASVQGDRLMLRRALSNLLSNAIRHTPDSETVYITIETQNNTIKLTVKNPGIAIAAEHLNKLFDRFYRVDPSRQRGAEGAGLGLSIVKSIVGAHHGKIKVTSDDNYTQFCISIPTHYQ